MTPGNVSTYTDLELALMVLLGCFGNGSARRQALGDRYADAQGLVDRILSTGKVPDGSGADPEQIKKAVMQTFYDVIEKVTDEVIKNL